MSLPERDREKTLSASTMESDCPAAPDLPPTQADMDEAAESHADLRFDRDTKLWYTARTAFLAGAAWRARQ